MLVVYAEEAQVTVAVPLPATFTVLPVTQAPAMVKEEVLSVIEAVAGVVMVGADGTTVLRSQVIVAAADVTDNALVCVTE